MPRLLIGNVKGVKGDTGAQGERGLAGTIEVGSVQTVSYGSPASVTNSGTEEEAILDFQIPQGAPGAQVTDMSNLVLNTITESTADYPAFAVSETGSTIFGKIRKFLSDLKTKYVSKSMMTTSTNIDTAGQAVADAKAIKSLNDSLAHKILTFNHTFTLSGGMTAGVVGSRAGQQRYIDPHPEYTLIGLMFINIADSNMYNPKVFYNSGSIYCNWYRASSNSASEEQTTVIVRLVYST